MFLTEWRKWIDNLARLAGRRQRRGRWTVKPRKPYLPLLEPLEVRWVPSFSSITPYAIAATEGAAFTGTAASFTTSTPGDIFTASIDWGDGTVSPGTVGSTGPGSFAVTGNHTYADEATGLAATVTVVDTTDNTTATAKDTATVADAPLSAGPAPSNLSSVEGNPVSGPVAAFTDGNPSATTADFPDGNLTIHWGDGTSSAGTVSQTGGPGSAFTVSGSHTYTEDGNYSITVDVRDEGGSTLTGAAGTTANILEDGLSYSGGAPITVSEGVSTGTVTLLTFSHANGLEPVSSFTANIDWGDGQSDTGVSVTQPGGSGNPYTVNGSHTYSEDGTYPIQVNIIDDGGFETGNLNADTATVTEADLAVTGDSVSGTEGSASTFTVATFSDTGSPDSSGAFSATIDWGDGSPMTTGTVTGSGGAFTVTGNHSYPDEGTFTGTVTVAETGVTGGTASATFAATVAEGDTLSPIGGVIGPLYEGQFASGPVAYFNDSNKANTAGDFTATIDWGDGTTTPGNVAGGGGQFTVSGGHAYADEGSYDLTIILREDAPGSASATAHSSGSVQDSDVLTVPTSQPTVTATEGRSVTNVPVATFTDTGYPGNPASDFTATIDWGDGSAVSGASSISNDGNGNFTVYGSHAYAEDGQYTPTVTLIDDPAQDNNTTLATATAVATSSADVAEADLAVTGDSVSGTEGSASTFTVATFSDTGSPDSSGAFSATIDWGDGSPMTTGTVTGSGGAFTVTGNHSYPDEGTFTGTVTVAETGVTGGTASATFAATVAEGDSLTPAVSQPTVSVTEGTSFSDVPVATFTDTGYPGNPASDFTATINWGDGVTADGNTSVSNDGSGHLTVYGSHSYAEEGTYPVRVTLAEDGYSTFATTISTATVANAPLSVTATAVSATEGQAFTGQVATFSDAGGLEADSDYSASIAWGDGLVGAGMVSNGTVTGSHAYAEEGSYTVTVTVTDDPGSPLAVSASGTAAASVANAPLSVTATPVSATEGASFTGQVATFSDAGGLEAGSDYSASIAWGDGLVGTGMVSNGTVTGSHAYAEEGSYTVTVTVTDDPGSPLAASASGTAPATVADASLTATPSTVSATEGQTFSGAVASFTDADPNGQPGDYTDTITWGDGASSSGSVVANGQGGFNVLGSHAYSEEGTYTVSVSIQDSGGASTSASTTATVADAPLTAQGVALAPQQATPYSGTVADFTDADPNGMASDYTATINWGDGSTSPGTIAGSEASGYQVQGSHAYLQSGNYAVQVVIHDLGGASATANSSAAVAVAPYSALAAYPQQGFEGFAMTNVLVASFTHGGGAEPARLFTASINWGDGTVSPGTVTQGGDGAYSVTGSHTYLDEPPVGLVVPGSRLWPITVSVGDPSSRSSVQTVGIVLEPLPAGTADVSPLHPYGTANDRFAAELFNDLTGGRRIDAARLNNWARYLRHHSRRSLVSALLTPGLLRALHRWAAQAGGGSSAGALVQGYYRLFLDRPALDPSAGLAKLREGGESALITFLLTSEEYFGKTVLGG